MKKLPDWEIKYREFATEHKDTPFLWGVWDCCMFSNALIKAMTGEDLIPKTLKWKDEKTAKKAIRDYGKTILGSITKAAKSKKGIKPIDKAYMTKGDLVVFKQESQLVGICDGMSILSPSEDGIEVLQNDLAVKVWRIDG
jgi:hypothetical protein|tara:strand:+ start:1352 stop:1771 length:420 start_codon:yes stop_codon:yes gene_type:complete